MNAGALVHCNITRPAYRTLESDFDSAPHPMTSVEGCGNGKREVISLFWWLRVDVSIAK